MNAIASFFDQGVLLSLVSDAQSRGVRSRHLKCHRVLLKPISGIRITISLLKRAKYQCDDAQYLLIYTLAAKFDVTYGSPRCVTKGIPCQGTNAIQPGVFESELTEEHPGMMDVLASGPLPSMSVSWGNCLHISVNGLLSQVRAIDMWGRGRTSASGTSLQVLEYSKLL